MVGASDAQQVEQGRSCLTIFLDICVVIFSKAVNNLALSRIDPSLLERFVQIDPWCVHNVQLYTMAPENEVQYDFIRVMPHHSCRSYRIGIEKMTNPHVGTFVGRPSGNRKGAFTIPAAKYTQSSRTYICCTGAIKKGPSNMYA